MTEPSEPTTSGRVEFRSGPWDASARSDLRTRIGFAFLVVAGPVLVAVSNLSSRPGYAWIGLAFAAAWLVASCVDVMSMWRERVVVTIDAVELWRWRTDRPRDRVMRTADLWGARFRSETIFGRRVGSPELVLSDGTRGLRLRNPRLVARHAEIVDSLGVDAPTVRQAVARRRCPESFSRTEREPVLAVALGIALAVVGGTVALILI